MKRPEPHAAHDDAPHPLERLIACPTCDALYAVEPVGEGQRARCRRCATTLIAPKAQAFENVAVLALTAVVLLGVGVFLPFLGVASMGFRNESSIFGAALAFSGRLAPLSVAVLAMIVLLPLARFLGLIYVLTPLALGRRPLTGAATVFRIAEELRPWSMAEVFVIGTAVAVVKVAGIATVTLGPAFWAFSAMILVVAFADSFMCRWTVWNTLDSRGTS